MKEPREFTFFDAHCHLQEPEIVGDLEHMLERWKNIKGGSIVCCGTKERDWSEVIAISREYEYVIPSLGLHPWFINEASSDWVDTLIQAVPYISGIGEIGLDFILKELEPAFQEKVFTTQLDIAREYELPVSIHVRKGWDTFIRILKHVGLGRAGGVIHSYSGSADMVGLFEKYGLHISFSGSVTNPHNKKVIKALKAVSHDRLLIETDSPAILPKYLPCIEHRKTFKESVCSGFYPSSLYSEGWNEPANLLMVAVSVSEILGMSIPSLAALTSLNGEMLFRSSPVPV
ncbi:TatD2 [Desulfamplus magnetovallimortis]|uniref:TatD2 n=1 Tax=Desulfamplus magnetovallimortis TaxID=1246637 RepID=A0A1W1H585_9BACT|nr:TatD family hydrolase [Desulfamplus magnetovallimortis]SLM27641.1 TatD2 [Desulfamplus magnetovallimortis]